MSNGFPATDFSAAAAGARDVGLPFPVSRRTDPVSIRPGARVIIRQLVNNTASRPGRNLRQQVSDIIGTLISVDPLIVEPQGTRDRVEVDPAGVVVLKTLSARPVRNSDIRAVETAAAAAFPGLKNEWIDGWLARAGDGITERSNSAVPIGPGASTQPVPLERIRRFYQDQDLPTRLLIPDRLGRPADNLDGTLGPQIIVMTRELSAHAAELNELVDQARASIDLPGANAAAPDVQFQVSDHPSHEWLSMYHFRGEPLPENALQLLCQRIEGSMAFASLTVDGQLAAITRATITDGGSRTWLGLSAVEVAPRFRRHHLGTFLTSSILQWGAEHGADEAFLHVVEDNTAGRALYHQLGFSEHHRHRCLEL